MEDLLRFPRELLCSGGNLINGKEFLVYCPYDRSHRILNHRYSAHLIKCRTNYELRKTNDGEERPPMAVCRYNTKHRMYEPEQSYHEHNCTDKKLLWLKNALPTIVGDDPKIDIQNGNTPRKSPKIYAEDEVLTLSQVMDPDSFGYKRRPERYHRRLMLPTFNQSTLEVDSDGKWKKMVRKPSMSFDWLKHQYNLKGPNRRIPPGLTKAQRKKYEIALTERLKCEEGIFVEEDEVEEMFLTAKKAEEINSQTKQSPSSFTKSNEIQVLSN